MRTILLLAVCKSIATTFSSSRTYHITSDYYEDDAKITKQDIYETAGGDEILSYSPLFDNNKTITL